MNRILVIRGGAIGDFILTLPALKLLREAFPTAHLEILGHKHILALAEQRSYADAIRSIEYSSLASFFCKEGDLAAELTQYFASFGQIVSYLFDPDEIFVDNLRRSGARNILIGSPKFTDEEHAARQLARPLEQLALYLEDAAAVISPNENDRQFARKFLHGTAPPFIAIHAGSGSERKNWPIENWTQLGEWLLALPGTPTLLIVGGEADDGSCRHLTDVWPRDRILLARNLPLPHLAAVLEQCALYFGHDTGISHLAAAVGVQSLLLFGPTDPAIWAPVGENVKVVRAPGGDLRALEFPTVRDMLEEWRKLPACDPIRRQAGSLRHATS